MAKAIIELTPYASLLRVLCEWLLRQMEYQSSLSRSVCDYSRRLTNLLLLDSTCP